MKSKLLPLLLCSLILSTCAQAEDPNGEEAIILSPFTVSTEADSYSFKALGSTGLNPSYVEQGQFANVKAPVSIIKRADAVAIQFVLTHSGDKQELRNKELYDSVEAVEREVKKIPDLRIEQREVKFTGGNKRYFSSSKNGSLTSFVNILILAELSQGTRVVDQVKRVRDLLMATKLTGQTKYSDGYIGLYLKNPDQHRREILQKIFDDMAFMKQGFANEFEIRPSGLTQKVSMRAVSESEIELWIDYSFSFVSLRELQRPAK